MNLNYHVTDVFLGSIDMMITGMDILLDFLKYALWHRKVPDIMFAKDVAKVLTLAEQQTVLGLVFGVLKNMQTNGKSDKRLLLTAYAKTEKIIHNNADVNKELVDFANRCNQQEIDYLVVKGQTIGCLYPNPELRQAGDIDFLFPIISTNGLNEDYQAQCLKMRQIFPEVKLPERMLEPEVGFKRNGVLYELHTNLRVWAKKRHQVVWNTLMEKEWQERHYIEIDGVKVRTLSPTVNAAYVFIHLFFHFIREGVSFRQLCDWVMVLHHYKDEIDKDRLIEILSALDVFDAYSAFGTILVDYLGLPANEFPIPLGDNDRKWQDKIIKDIFQRGNFGKLNHSKRISWLGSWQYKIETMRVALQNSVCYYSLCPSEIGGMIPRLIKGNLKILMER